MKRPVNILIVDDNQDNLKVVSNILKEKGFKIALSLDGSSALKTLDSVEVDLVLLDVMMPGMNGFEVCKRIKENPKTKNIPVIFVTADTDDIREGFRAGAVDYISKPFKTDELLARVNNQVQLAIAQESLNETIEKLTAALNSTEMLLKNLLPSYVISEYKQSCMVQPKTYSNACILVADLMYFTNISTSLSPEVLFNEINDIYTNFDEILDRNSCERIKTSGSTYLGACGIEPFSENPTAHIIKSASEIIDYISCRNLKEPLKWEIRIGIDSGQVIGGIIGEKKFRFDILGKPVSTAFYLASIANAMQVIVSDEIYNSYKSKFELIKKDPGEK